MVAGCDQVRPPSVDVVTRCAVGPARPSNSLCSVNVSTDRYARPSGPNETHGSLVRSSAPPVQRDMPGRSTCFHVRPPSFDTPTTSLSAPPSIVNRSCCHTAIRLRASRGFTASDGSPSLSGLRSPGTPQPSAANGDREEIGMSPLTAGAACAVAEAASAPATTTATSPSLELTTKTLLRGLARRGRARLASLGGQPDRDLARAAGVPALRADRRDGRGGDDRDDDRRRTGRRRAEPRLAARPRRRRGLLRADARPDRRPPLPAPRRPGKRVGRRSRRDLRGRPDVHARRPPPAHHGAHLDDLPARARRVEARPAPLRADLARGPVQRPRPDRVERVDERV